MHSPIPCMLIDKIARWAQKMGPKNMWKYIAAACSYTTMVFFIPGTDAKIFQGARRVFTFHIEIFSLLSELANSVMKRSKCEKWKLFKPLEKFKQKGLGWVICFLRLIEVYLYAIINYFNLPRKVDSLKEILKFLDFLKTVSPDYFTFLK